MPNRPGAYFIIKYNQSLGHRLVLHKPTDNIEVKKSLEHDNITPARTITVGYYRRLPNPKGAWCFMPVNTPAARALLFTRLTQKRIAHDLISIIDQQPLEGETEQSNKKVTRV